MDFFAERFGSHSGLKFRAMLNRSKKSIQAGKGLSEDEFWKAVRERAKTQSAQSSKIRKRRRTRESN
jgi:hypothetical protein